MEKLGLNEIRSRFLKFYESKDHYVGKSASLIPRNDKSILIINSGMAPLKAYFAGTETPPKKRMCTCQKCIRTGDIDNVGHTARHGTFFEMLGNFSFGDYFKKESLTWGIEFLTEHLGFTMDKLWATVYLDDEEAIGIWKSLGMNPDHIVRLGKEDNFWEIGLGPCGPDSEIRVVIATDFLKYGTMFSLSSAKRKTAPIQTFHIRISTQEWDSKEWRALCKVQTRSLMLTR